MVLWHFIVVVVFFLFVFHVLHSWTFFSDYAVNNFPYYGSVFFFWKSSEISETDQGTTLWVPCAVTRINLCCILNCRFYFQAINLQCCHGFSTHLCICFSIEVYLYIFVETEVSKTAPRLSWNCISGPPATLWGEPIWFFGVLKKIYLLNLNHSRM